MGYAMKQREGETKQKRKGARGRVEERKTGGGGKASSGELAGIRGLGWMG